MYIEQLPSGRYRAEVRQYGTRKKVRQTFDYRHEAEAWATATEASMAAIAAAVTPEPEPVRPLRNAPCGVTVTEHATEWLAGKASLTMSSRLSYARHVAAIAASDLGHLDLAQVTKPMVLTWQTRADREGLGRYTNNARLLVLRMVYLDAIAQGIVRANPTYKVANLTAPLRKDRVVTPDEEFRVLAAAEDPAAVAFILCGLDGGLRWGEIAGLTAGAVSGDYLTVYQVLETRTRSIRPFPKGKRPRVVPMTERLRAALAPLVEACGDDLDALVFTSEGGHLLDYNNWRKNVWKPALRAAKVSKPAPRFHDLRHTCGTRLAAKGTARYQIAEILGHADESTTGRYIHAGEDGARLAMVRAALG